MRALELHELRNIYGGNNNQNTNKIVENACEGQPDSANVTLTAEMSTNIGGAIGKFLGLGAESSSSTTISVNCGEFRESQKSDQAGKKG